MATIDEVKREIERRGGLPYEVRIPGPLTDPASETLEATWAHGGRTMFGRASHGGWQHTAPEIVDALWPESVGRRGMTISEAAGAAGITDETLPEMAATGEPAAPRYPDGQVMRVGDLIEHAFDKGKAYNVVNFGNTGWPILSDGEIADPENCRLIRRADEPDYIRRTSPPEVPVSASVRSHSGELRIRSRAEADAEEAEKTKPHAAKAEPITRESLIAAELATADGFLAPFEAASRVDRVLAAAKALDALGCWYVGARTERDRWPEGEAG